MIDTTSQLVNVHGIGDSSIPSVPLGTAAGLITSTQGPVIGFFHQYALHGKGKTIHSANQLRAFGNLVDDIPKRLNGTQRIVTHDGYKIPLSIRKGLAYMDMRPPTDEEMKTYPHIILTSNRVWDPGSLSNRVWDPGTLHVASNCNLFDAEQEQAHLKNGEQQIFEDIAQPTKKSLI